MTVGPHKIESSTGPTSDDASFSRAPGGPASELAMRVWASARDAESSGTARESELCATERIFCRTAKAGAGSSASIYHQNERRLRANGGDGSEAAYALEHLLRELQAILMRDNYTAITRLVEDRDR